MLKVAWYLLINFHFDRLGIKATICKINNFSIVKKIVVEKFSFRKLTIEKVKFFTQSPTKVFCISVFNVEGCLVAYKNVSKALQMI